MNIVSEGSKIENVTNCHSAYELACWYIDILNKVIEL